MLPATMRFIPGLLVVFLNAATLHADQTAVLILAGQVIDQFGAPVDGAGFQQNPQYIEVHLTQNAG